MGKMSIKIISIFCMIAMSLTTLAGCGGANSGSETTASAAADANSTTTTAASAAAENLPEATITLELTGMPETVQADQDSNVLVKYIEEKLNVKLRFMCDGTSANDGTALERLHLETGQAGDILCIPKWGGGATQMMEDAVVEGLFVNMGEIAAKNPGRYPTLEKCFSDVNFQYYNAQFYKQTKENYAFWAGGYTTFPQGAPVYNMQIMNSLGAKIPATLDEFVSYLRLVKAKKPGIIPFNFRNDKGVKMGESKACELNQIFFQTQGTEMNRMVKDSNGVWSDSAIDPKNKEIWKQLASYYKDGLIDKEFFVYKDDSYMTDKFATGKLAVASCSQPNQNYTSFLNVLDIFAKANPDIKKEDLLNYVQEQPQPLTGPGGSGSYEDTSFSIHYGDFITSTCKNPERAMDVLNFLASDEGMTLLWYGIKGVHYVDQDADGNVTGVDEEKTKKMEADNKNWALWSTVTFWVCMLSGSGQIYFIDRNNGWTAALKKQSGMISYPSQPQANIDYSVKTWKQWSDTAFIADPQYYDAMKNISSVEDIYAKIKEIKTKYFVNFVTGSTDVEANWDKFTKELKDAGLETYVKTYSDLEKGSKFKFEKITGAAN